MSESSPARPVPAQDPERLVADYLRDHPDFFTRHLELLNTLTVPHDCHPAVSLIERQLALFREQNVRLRRKLLELIEMAQRNDRIAERMQRLSLVLIEADTLEDLLMGIQAVLRDEFSAEFTALRLAARPLGEDPGVAEVFVSPAALAPLERILSAGSPQCGRFSQDQLNPLFADSAPRIASAVLVPVRGTDWQGLLAVGSREEGRFQPGMGTLFLRRMGELIGCALAPYLTAP
ncbi:MAG: DUF484 family protein [Candidatus Competibacteraceae bacterium]|nr:DUF484 family protein [Candidatus Competibacteraceae bacterium]